MAQPTQASPAAPYFVKIDAPILIGDATDQSYGPLFLRQPVRNPVSTTLRNVSMPSDTAPKFAENEFRMAYVGKRIPERLLLYVDTKAHSVGDFKPDKIYRTTDTPGRPDTALPTSEFARAVADMTLAELSTRMSQHPSDVQDEAESPIFRLLNCAIMMKEPNRISEENLPEILDWDHVVRGRSHPADVDSGAQVSISDVKEEFFSPCWQREPPETLSAGNRKVGTADYVLLSPPKKVLATCEMRVPWSFPTSDIWEFFHGDEKYFNKWLNMVYGHVRAHPSPMGFITNMSVIIFYFEYEGKATDADRQLRVDLDRWNAEAEDLMNQWEARRAAAPSPEHQGHPGLCSSGVTFKNKLLPEPLGTGQSGQPPLPNWDKPVVPRRSGLVFSWPMPYSHELALKCLQGLTFLALDREYWLKDDPSRSIVDMVAPGDEVEQITDKLEQPAHGQGLVAPYLASTRAVSP